LLLLLWLITRNVHYVVDLWVPVGHMWGLRVRNVEARIENVERNSELWDIGGAVTGKIIWLNYEEVLELNEPSKDLRLHAALEVGFFFGDLLLKKRCNFFGLVWQLQLKRSLFTLASRQPSLLSVG